MNEVVCVLYLFCSQVFPMGNYVPNREGVFRFGVPVVALLAHNYLDGRYFNQIEIGDVVRYYGSEIKDYKVKWIVKMQTLDPGNPYSLYNENGVINTPDDIWRRFYVRDGLLFQTCIEKDGLSTWGIMFIFAEEYGHPTARFN